MTQIPWFNEARQDYMIRRAGKDGVCILDNEMPIYPGVSQIYTAISKMYFNRCESPEVSERMWSVHLDVSISGEYQTVGG
jgi:hypothetical protein